MTPYRQPVERQAWKPKPGDRIVILPSEWARSYGHDGKKGHVVTMNGWWCDVYVGGGRGANLHVYVTEIAPLVD
jgi:hypothetical protein